MRELVRQGGGARRKCVPCREDSLWRVQDGCPESGGDRSGAGVRAGTAEDREVCEASSPKAL